MKILAIHSDYLKFEPKKKAIKEAEEFKEKSVETKECLVIFTAVEKIDEKNPEQSAKNLVKESTNIADQVKANKIVLYPYAHLSSSLADPTIALNIMKKAEALLKQKFEVIRAPFGCYKAFEIKCKGHPLSELSREFSSEVEEPCSALEAEKTLKSDWFILDKKGKLNNISIKNNDFLGYDFSKNKNLKDFALYEMAKVRAVQEEPPHVKFMRKLEIADYEPGSDPGNLRFFAKGRMIKALIEEYVTKKMQEYNALEVETPIMYDYEHPALKDYLSKFPARQYTIQTPNKKVFLRFAACFGQFLMAKHMTLSYKILPIKMYELTKYSFRVEQRGELTGLRRLRAFTMPDCHAICQDLDQAKDEMLKRFDIARKVVKEIGVNSDRTELAIRITKEFWEENKDFILKLIKKWNKPILIEMWPKKAFYFIMKYEINFVDALRKASALSTDQIDIENSKRYGITYIDKKGDKQYPILLHLSPSGAIERVIYALLEQVCLDEKKAILPLWLSPTQVRIIPVSTKKHMKVSDKLSLELEKENIRVDIDDTDETIGKRIRSSELEWTPITIVIGDKEMKGNKLPIRLRDQDKVINMTKKQLIDLIKKETEDLPFRPLPLPKYISKRAKFIG